MAASVAVMVLVGCARASAPPGGEPDDAPPRLTEVRPEAKSVVPGWDEPVVFQFNERISEQGIENVVLVSPATGAVEVDKGRSDLEVALEGGWQPGQIYRIVLTPGIADLFGNVTARPLELVFSTGPPIPETALAGEVVDRLTLEPVEGARVAATRLADSVTHVAASDSSGFYFMRNIPMGAYELRAYQDQNTDGEPDAFEAQDMDAATLGAGDTALVSFNVLVPDTTAARLARAEARDTAHVQLAFDDYMDPLAPLDSVQVTLLRLPDSTRVEVAEVLHAHVWQQRVELLAAAREAAMADSVQGDSLAALLGADSLSADSIAAALRAANRAGNEVVPAGGLPPELAAMAEATELPAGDTAGAARDSVKGPLPARELVIVPAEPLAWQAQYSVSVSGVTNIAGLPGGGGSAEFETPPSPSPPAADTTGAVRPDTVVGAAPDTRGGVMPDTAREAPSDTAHVMPPDVMSDAARDTYRIGRSGRFLFRRLFGAE